MGCPEGREREAVQGSCEAGNDLQLPLINDECVSFSSFKKNILIGSHKGISRTGIFASQNLGDLSKSTPFVLQLNLLPVQMLTQLITEGVLEITIVNSIV